MKRLAALAIVFCSSVFCSSVAFAGLSDFDITVEGKLLDQSTKSESDKKKTTQQWAYDVSMINKSTKDFANLKIKYIVFVKDAREGGKPGDSRMVRKPGAASADSIKSHAKYDFQTDKVDISKTQLQGGWVYTSGARPRTSDSLAGIWIRVYDGEKQIAEFANPPTLPSKEKWDVK